MEGPRPSTLHIYTHIQDRHILIAVYAIMATLQCTSPAVTPLVASRLWLCPVGSRSINQAIERHSGPIQPYYVVGSN
jgi:hypothetical protein